MSNQPETSDKIRKTLQQPYETPYEMEETFQFKNHAKKLQMENNRYKVARSWQGSLPMKHDKTLETREQSQKRWGIRGQTRTNLSEGECPRMHTADGHCSRRWGL